ncbi:MAG: EAL and HDOD domain-containing protein [Acidithiobacillus sp.]
MMSPPPEVPTESKSVGPELVARQAIMGRHGEVIAYELFARDSETILADPFLASARVLVKAFSWFPVESLLGGKPAFVNFTDSLFDEKSLELFPVRQIVPEFLDKILALKKHGFRLALDRFSGLPWQLALLPLMDYVKIDLYESAPADWQRALMLIRRAGSITAHLATVATRVETRALAQQCFEAGFDYAQGYYFMRPEIVAGKKLSSQQRVVFHLINLLAAEGPLEEIEEGFRRDPALSYQLLRYLNSAGLRRGETIDSIRRALVLLGRQPLQRWLTLLMFTTQGPARASLALQASTRARLAEIIRENSTTLDQHPAALHRSFLVGMLSLLDALMDQPMPDLLNELHLADALREALLSRTGEDGQILALVEAIERQDEDAAQKLRQRLGLPDGILGRLSLDALAWSAALP